MHPNDVLALLVALGLRAGEVEDRLDAVQLKEGRRGPPGPKPKHEWDGTRLRFERPDGKWGEWVDLQGKDGITRIVGGGGGGGGVGFDPDALPLASNTTPDLFLVHQAGGWRRASYAQMRSWFPSGTSTPQPVTVNGTSVTVGGAPVTVT